MAQKLFIERRAADNKYLHRDFHCALDQGLAYLGARYGGAAVEEYLYRFAEGYYAPLIAEAKARGLSAIRDHILGVYETEEAPGNVRCSLTEDGLAVSVSACPAVAYMRSVGYEPSEWYVGTTSTVNRAVADALGLSFALLSYDQATGAAEYRFFARREVPE